MFNVTEQEAPPWEGLGVVVDFDEIAYNAASGNEVRGIKVKEKTPFAPYKEFSTKTEFYASIGGKKNAEEYLIEEVQYPFKLEKAFHKVDEAMERIFEKCRTRDYVGYMGSGSPRDAIATVEVYKGQRAGLLRPVQLTEVRDYCVSKWGAKVVNGAEYEADDMLAIEATQNGRIACTVDKDAQQVGGTWLLKPEWSEPRYLDTFGWLEVDRSGKTVKAKGAGEKWLAFQICTKDDADNYHANKLSSKKFGIVGGVDLLKDCKNSKELWGTVLNHFRWLYPEDVEYSHAYSGKLIKKNYIQLFDEYFQLAFMLRNWGGYTAGHDYLISKGVTPP